MNVGSITPSPLRHSSLYQVLEHDTPALPGQGTVHSGVSSIAHALQPQELQTRQALPMCTPVLGNTQVASTSPATVVVDLCSTVLQTPAGAPSAQVPPPVSSATPPCASAPPAENGSVITPLGGHTLSQSLPEVTIHDYDTNSCLCKVSPPGPRRHAVSVYLRNLSHDHLVQLQPANPGSAKEDQSATSSPLSPLSSPSSSSMGASAAFSRDGKSALKSVFTLPLSGRKDPVSRSKFKLACLSCRQRKIRCRPLPGVHQYNTCQ
jgi:hypothetical protein